MLDANLFDELMMRRAIELARRGLGFVEPNPAVGAIVVDSSGTVVGPKPGQRRSERRCTSRWNPVVISAKRPPARARSSLRGFIES